MDGSLRYQSFTQPQTSAVTRRAESKIREAYSVSDTGAIGDGLTDASAAINQAIANLQSVGGGVLHLLDGKTYLLDNPLVFAGACNVLIDGHGCTFLRGKDMPAGQGVMDLQAAQHVTFKEFTLDGAVTVSQGVLYSTFAFDPMNGLLTQNTSVWIHGNSRGIFFDRVTIQHTGGYAILSDTRTGGNNYDIRVLDSIFINNRPHLFGTNVADLNYGSWTGGIFYKGDCNSVAALFVTVNLLVQGCVFERNTGNQVWGHNYGFQSFHTNIQIVNNQFLDIGLDAIQPACAVSGAVVGNSGRRIGYICVNDIGPSTPKYLAGFNATFLDDAGYTECISFTGNSCESVCGGFCSLDGYAYGSVTGNSFRQPVPGDVLYVEDQIALIPAGVVYGITGTNTSINQGGDGVVISGNTFYNCTAGAILVNAMRNGKIIGNDIWQAGNSTDAPILLFNGGSSSIQRSYGNSITGNRIYWSPPTPQACIQEVDFGFPWVAGDMNWVADNHIFDTTGMAFEFYKDPNTSSITRTRITSEVSHPTAVNYGDIVRLSNADGTGGYTSFYKTSGTEVMRVADAGLVTVDGGFGTGVVANLYDSVADFSVIGTANTTGVTVNRVSGTPFFAGMVGGNLTINGFLFIVATFVNANQVTVTATVGTQTGVSYSFGNGFQTSNGSFQVTGSGIILCQIVIATTTFSSRADLSASPSTTAAFQTSTGTFVIFGDGNAQFQNVSALTFNSTAIGTQHAFQTVGGSFVIFGSGDAQFQTVKATTVFNSLADTSGSPSTTAAFQTSGGDVVIYGDGHGTFQYLLSLYYSFVGLAAAPATPAAGFASLYYDTVIGALRYNLAGAGWVSIGTGGAAGANTQVQFNNSGAFGASANFTFAGNILTVGSGAGTGVIAPLFNGNAGSTNLEFQGTNFSVRGDGHIATNGYLDFGNITATTPTPTAGHGYIYSAAGTLMVSQNGAAAVNLLGGGSSPGGANTDIQFNNSGAFGGSSSLTWNGAILTANAVIASNGLTVSASGISVTGGITVVSGSVILSAGTLNASGNLVLNGATRLNNAGGAFLTAMTMNGSPGFTGTLAAAIAGGRNVDNGIII